MPKPRRFQNPLKPNQLSSRNDPQISPLSVLEQFRIVYGTTQRHYRLIERKCGLGGAHLWALFEIRMKPLITVGDLAIAMVVHQSTASNLVERLARSGLVARSRSLSDRRIVHLKITDRGKILLTRAPKPANGILLDALQRTDRRSLRSLAAVLSELVSNLKRSHRRSAAKPLAQM